MAYTCLPFKKKNLTFPKSLEVRAMSHYNETAHATNDVTLKTLNEVTIW